MKSQRTGALALPVVLAVMTLAGCPSPIGHGTMTFDEVVEREAALQNGEAHEFELSDLAAAAQREFLELLGRPHGDPNDYAGVTIGFQRQLTTESRASSRVCSSTRRYVGHVPGCFRPGYRVATRRIPNHGRCSHAGYTEAARAKEKTMTCFNKKCVYLSVRRWYYHQAI